MFNPIWNLADIKQDKDVKVFSIFSCGGGSSMGYKRAGFDVIGNCEIDDEMNEVYVKNHHPRFNFKMDIRDFVKKDDLPGELYDLDILDGSPPCSTFSMCGSREEAWGKEKMFKEGQKKQILDDLFFVFLDAVERLQPKIVVAENVVGIVQGNAKGYCNEIVNRFKAIGYDVQIFKLNSAFMEVPQRRERIFFVANRMGFPKLRLKFNYQPIPFWKIKSREGGEPIIWECLREALAAARYGDKSLADVNRRLGWKAGLYNFPIIWDDDVPTTITANRWTYMIRGCDKTSFSVKDIVTAQTFPQDFDFCGYHPKIICGMSVPPNMMAHIAYQLWRQWLKPMKEGRGDDVQC